MMQSQLILQTSAAAPIQFSFYAQNPIDFSKLQELVDATNQTLKHSMAGFNNLKLADEQSLACQNLIKKFRDRKILIHLGMGGSVLGAEVLLESLQLQLHPDKKIITLNNLDAEWINQQLSTIDLLDSVILVVTKSGNTLETLILMQLLFNKLRQDHRLHALTDDQIHQKYFVVATDPKNGPLRELANKKSLAAVAIPSELGGRFSVLSCVGFMPAHFAGLEVQKILDGAKACQQFFLHDDQQQSIYKLAQTLLELYHQGFNQTVMMPYSSKLKCFSSWFVQLWSESLGKAQKGFTPIAAFGPADQHSQLQLYLDGPKNKVCFFTSLQNSAHDFSLTTTTAELSKQLNPLRDHQLTQVIKAQLIGTMAALQQKSLPFVHIELTSLSEQHLGALLYFFELLTIIVGSGLKIDPFDQPAVELGKKLTWDYIQSGKTPLVR